MLCEESLQWLPFNPKSATRGLKGATILAIRGDGKGYYGKVIEITKEFAELENGSQKQLLRFFDSPTVFAIVSGPPPRQRRLAERKLIW